jgi:hypothetical protein
MDAAAVCPINHQPIKLSENREEIHAASLAQDPSLFSLEARSR